MVRVSKKRKKKVLSINNLPICPKCKSKTTVGLVVSYDNIKWARAGRCYFCSNCLTEFDDEHIKEFNQDGSSIRNVDIQR